MAEPLPLATIHDAVLQFLRGRDDAVLFGALAVNAYVNEPRMTQDVDILSPRARELADELRTYSNERFHIAIRVGEVRDGIGYRLYQVRQPKNRHLAEVRPVNLLPEYQSIDGVAVLVPPELICHKILSMVSRSQTAKGLTDGADLRRLLLTFPELKSEQGAVHDALRTAGASDQVFAAWRELVAQEILPENEDDEFQ